MGTAGLSAGAVVALLLAILRRPVDGDLVGRERTARLFLIGLAAQCLHFMEEFVTRFQDRFPALFGLPAWSDPLAFGKTVQTTIHELNADLVVFEVTTLESSEQIASFPQRVAGTFVGAFGLLALVLAAVGIYGVTAYTTRQRTHEIGIRMALGGSKEDILRLVLGQGIRLALVGVSIGLVVSILLTRFLKKLLHTGAARHKGGSNDGFTVSVIAPRGHGMRAQRQSREVLYVVH
jgi:hypothetical protein